MISLYKPSAKGRARFVMALVLMSTVTLAVCGDGFDLGWWTIDGGGWTFSTGGDFELGGTIGQPDASSPMTGGDFELSGGFWPGTSVCEPCDTNCDGSINGGDIQWFIDLLNGVGAPCSWCAGDTNRDGSINGSDIENFIQCLNAP